jgi:hypothetical protein
MKKSGSAVSVTGIYQVIIQNSMIMHPPGEDDGSFQEAVTISIIFFVKPLQDMVYKKSNALESDTCY